MADDYDDAGRCPTCDSRRHTAYCTGFPGAVYAHHGQGWFNWTAALDLEAEGVEVEWDDIWSYSYYGKTPPDRIVVVDLETSGLDPIENEMLEVAWHDLSHDEIVHSAVVPHTLASFSREALAINRYRERDLGNMDNWCEPRHLSNVLSAVFEGAVIAGSHTDFDKSFLRAWDWHTQTWTHTPLEIGSVAMGYLNRRHPLRMRELPEALRLTRQPDHTAEGDVWVVIEALHRMWSES